MKLGTFHRQAITIAHQHGDLEKLFTTVELCVAANDRLPEYETVLAGLVEAVETYLASVKPPARTPGFYQLANSPILGAARKLVNR